MKAKKILAIGLHRKMSSTVMAKRVFCILLLSLTFSVLVGCQSSTSIENQSAKTVNLTLQDTYQDVLFEKSEQFESGPYSFAQLDLNSPANVQMLYTLASYDSNGNRQHLFEDVLCVNTDAEQDNVICKICPGGYFTLSVKRIDSAEDVSVDFTISCFGT